MFDITLVDGTPPPGMQIVEGDLRQVYDTIASGDSKEYRFIIKPSEAGNYTVHLRTVYSDDEIGIPSESESITVTEKEKNYLYIVIPGIVIIFGMVIFAIKRHKEYSY